MFCSGFNNRVNNMINEMKEQRLNFITRISKKRRWDFGDGNPFFDEVFNHFDKIEAKTLRIYKRKLKERKKNERNRILAHFNKFK
jgi:hypothetical protein